MCRSHLHAFLQALPKCEHHMHLEGSLSPHLLLSLAKRHNVTLPQDDPAFASTASLSARYDSFTSLDDFLHYYYTGFTVLQTAADFQDLAWEYFVRANADGVRHAEVFFDPQAHTSRGISLSTIVDGITKARLQAAEELGISSILIACFLRHLPPSSALETMVSLETHLQSGDVSGIGLDSSELPFPPKQFEEVFNHTLASQPKILRTAHAGEEAPAKYVREAISSLNVTRIDHGINSADDDELLVELATRKIMLTVCPMSNLKLRNVKSIKDLPLNKFLQHNIAFSINSDDPAYFGAYCLENYCAVQESFDWGVKEWVKVVTASIGGSWVDDSRKDELLAELLKVQKQWEILGTD